MAAIYDDPGVLYDDPYVTYDGATADPGEVYPGLRFELNFDTHGDSGYLIVGDPARGLVGTGIVGPDLPDSGTWYEVAQEWTEELQTANGRQRLLEEYAPGTLNATLKNTDGRFDQFNLDGRYVSGGVSQIDAMRGARLSAEYPVGSGNWTYLWWGYTDSFQPHYADPATCDVQATDAFKVFNTDGPDTDINIAGGRSDLVIADILNRIGWPSDFRNLEVGQTMIGDFVWQANTTALSVVQLVARSEGGSFFVDGQNRATFLRRCAPYTGRSRTVQATFSNDLPPTPGGLPYFSPDPVRADDLVKNIVNVSNFSNPPASAQDNTSISRYGRKKFLVSNLINENTWQNEPYAQWVVQLNATAWDRIDTLTLTPRSDVRLWPVVIGARIKDRVRVVFRPWAGTIWSLDFLIEGIGHHILPGKDWTTTFRLLPALPYNTDAFIVGESKVGGPQLVGLF